MKNWRQILSWQNPGIPYEELGRYVRNLICEVVHDAVMQGKYGGVPKEEIIEKEIQRPLTPKEIEYMDEYYYKLLDKIEDLETTWEEDFEN